MVAASASSASLRDEAVQLLQQLIRLDTVNPPGNETQAAELLRAYLEPFGVECELYARVPGAGESGRADPRPRRRAEPAPALAHGHGAGRPGRVVGRPVVGRAAGRLRLGPRRARHEGPGGGERGRDRVARARGVRAGRRPDLRRDRRRGDGRGRRLRPRVAVRASIRRRCAATTPSTRARATASRSAGGCCTSARRRRSAALRSSLRRPRPQRPRVDAGDRRQRARQGGAADRAARRVRAGAGADAGDGGLSRGASRTRCRRRTRRSPLARAIDPVAAEMVEPLLGMTVAPTMIEASREAERDSRGAAR